MKMVKKTTLENIHSSVLDKTMNEQRKGKRKGGKKLC